MHPSAQAASTVMDSMLGLSTHLAVSQQAPGVTPAGGAILGGDLVDFASSVTQPPPASNTTSMDHMQPPDFSFQGYGHCGQVPPDGSEAQNPMNIDDDAHFDVFFWFLNIVLASTSLEHHHSVICHVLASYNNYYQQSNPPASGPSHNFGIHVCFIPSRLVLGANFRRDTRTGAKADMATLLPRCFHLTAYGCLPPISRYLYFRHLNKVHIGRPSRKTLHSTSRTHRQTPVSAISICMVATKPWIRLPLPPVQSYRKPPSRYKRRVQWKLRRMLIGQRRWQNRGGSARIPSHWQRLDLGVGRPLFAKWAKRSQGCTAHCPRAPG